MARRTLVTDADGSVGPAAVVRGLLACLLAAATLVVATPAAAVDQTSRLAGGDRFATAAAVSRAFFAPGVPVAYVATGRDFADALAGAPAAARDGAPLLLTEAASLPVATRDELARLTPGRIVVLGGPGTVADPVLAELGGLTEGTVTRLSGGNRFETAAAVAASVWPDGATTVLVATGRSFPDALAGGAAAAALDAPILLATRDALPQVTRDAIAALAPDVIWILGGTAAIGADVADELGALAGTVGRLAGADRFETAARVAEVVFERPTTTAFLAAGTDFPDALAAGPAAAVRAAPVLLSARDCVPVAPAVVLRDLAVERAWVVGGQSVLGPAVDDVTPCAPLPAEAAFTVFHLVPADVAVTSKAAAIRAEVASWQAWFEAQTGSRRVRVERDGGGQVRVVQRVLATTEADTTFATIYQALQADGLLTSDAHVLAFVDANTAPGECGRGGAGLAVYWNTECGQPSSATPADGVRLSVPAAISVHEVLHALGAVPDCAPNADRGHVVGEPTDVMVAILTSLDDLRLDIGRDDYFGHGRADCVDVADSAFLELV